MVKRKLLLFLSLLFIFWLFILVSLSLSLSHTHTHTHTHSFSFPPSLPSSLPPYLHPCLHLCHIYKSLSSSEIEVASRAQGHLEEARNIVSSGELEKNAIYALLPGVRSKLFLETLQNENFRILGDTFLNPPSDQLKYQLQLLKTVWMKSL